MLEVITLDQPTRLRGASCALGNFDGLHLGHQKVLENARVSDAPFALITFDPHPRQYFQPDTAPFRLTPLPAQVRIAEVFGVQYIYIVPFNEETATMSAASFVEDILVKRAGVSRLSVGSNFHFGVGREGDVEMLTQLGQSHGIHVRNTPLHMLDDKVVSSSFIRKALQNGDPETAAASMGRWFEVGGVVQHGDKRGRTLGYPTLNIPMGIFQRPRYGVYAVRVCIDATWYDGVASLGLRPMFAVNEPLLEVHVFDFEQDVYNKPVRVSFRKWLRPEQTFDGVDALVAQMHVDSETARRILATQPSPWEIIP